MFEFLLAGLGGSAFTLFGAILIQVKKNLGKATTHPVVNQILLSTSTNPDDWVYFRETKKNYSSWENKGLGLVVCLKGQDKGIKHITYPCRLVPSRKDERILMQAFHLMAAEMINDKSIKLLLGKDDG